MSVTDCQLEYAFMDYQESLLATCAGLEDIEAEQTLFTNRLSDLLNHSEHQDSILAAINQFFSGVKRWVA